MLFPGFPINQSHHFGDPEVVTTQNLIIFLSFPIGIFFFSGAISNAIKDALGIRLNDLPMKPSVILKALSKK